MRICLVDETIINESGTITQVTSRGTWKQLNIICKKAGKLGAGHYHLATIELFYIISGNLDVIAMAPASKSTQYFSFATGDCFEVVPLEQHYMKFKEDTVLAVLYSKPFNSKAPDIHIYGDLPPLEEVFNNS
jgi:hypothetical protein